MRDTLARVLASVRFEVNFHASIGATDTSEPHPSGDCYASTERADAHPIGFRIEPIE